MLKNITVKCVQRYQFVQCSSGLHACKHDRGHGLMLHASLAGLAPDGRSSVKCGVLLRLIYAMSTSDRSHSKEHAQTSKFAQMIVC